MFLFLLDDTKVFSRVGGSPNKTYRPFFLFICFTCFTTVRNGSTGRHEKTKGEEKGKTKENDLFFYITDEFFLNLEIHL